MITRDIGIDTAGKEVVDVTDTVRHFTQEVGGEGLVSIFLPHATAGVALMETGSGSEEDLSAALRRLLPRGERYSHRHGSPGHGADHLLPVLVSPSLTVPVADGRPRLGTWQRIVVVDLNHDNPQRTLRLSLVRG